MHGNSCIQFEDYVIFSTLVTTNGLSLRSPCEEAKNVEVRWSTTASWANLTTYLCDNCTTRTDHEFVEEVSAAPLLFSAAFKTRCSSAPRFSCFLSKSADLSHGMQWSFRASLVACRASTVWSMINSECSRSNRKNSSVQAAPAEHVVRQVAKRIQLTNRSAWPKKLAAQPIYMAHKKIYAGRYVPTYTNIKVDTCLHEWLDRNTQTYAHTYAHTINISHTRIPIRIEHEQHTYTPTHEQTGECVHISFARYKNAWDGILPPPNNPPPQINSLSISTSEGLEQEEGGRISQSTKWATWRKLSTTSPFTFRTWWEEARGMTSR